MIEFGIKDALDVLLVASLLFYVYRLMKESRSLNIFVGISRKSMIYKLMGGDATTSLNGTSVLDTIALMKGASILRVHDVKEAAEAVKIVETMKEGRV